LNDAEEGFSLITLGFVGLFADPADPEAAAFVRRSLDSQDNPRFQEGAAAGGTDVFVWVADAREKYPTRCFEHLKPMTKKSAYSHTSALGFRRTNPARCCLSGYGAFSWCLSRSLCIALLQRIHLL